MKLVVGLGNPGRQYVGTRHNCGYMVLDYLAEMFKLDIDRDGFKGKYVKFKLETEDVIFLKPETFMNLSGESVREIVNFYKINTEDIIVVYDDMALNPGTIRMRLKGSSGGQKGIQNIIDNLGTEEIKRVRIGIGEPEYNAIDYVLGKPTPEEKELIDKAIKKAAKALEVALFDGFLKAMTEFNGGDNA